MTADGADRPGGSPRFDVVLHGYDRKQVDEHIVQMQRVMGRMRADIDALRNRPMPAPAPVPPPGGFAGAPPGPQSAPAGPPRPGPRRGPPRPPNWKSWTGAWSASTPQRATW